MENVYVQREVFRFCYLTSVESNTMTGQHQGREALSPRNLYSTIARAQPKVGAVCSAHDRV